MPRARTHARAGEAGPENPASGPGGGMRASGRAVAMALLAPCGAASKGAAGRAGLTNSSDPCRRHCARRSRRGAMRIVRPAAGGAVPTRPIPPGDCDGCRRKNAESCRRTVLDVRGFATGTARDEWRAKAAADERARRLRGAQLRWLGKVSVHLLAARAPSVGDAPRSFGGRENPARHRGGAARHS